MPAFYLRVIEPSQLTIACATLPTPFRGNHDDERSWQRRAPLGATRTLLSGTALLGAALFGLADPTPASADQQFLKHGSLVVSSSTYDKTQGPVASLDGRYAAAQHGDSDDPGSLRAIITYAFGTMIRSMRSFGVTSAIQLTDIDLSNGKVFRSMQVPTNQVVTSFSSKSELGLHVLNNWPSVSVVFVGYASGATANGLNPARSGRRTSRCIEFRCCRRTGSDEPGDLRLREKLRLSPHHRLGR